MPSEKLLGSYLIRFVESNRQRHFNLHNLHTGERLEFETWVSVWCFLEERLSADGFVQGTQTALKRNCNATETPKRED